MEDEVVNDKKSEYRFFKADEFMVKFLTPGRRGVNVVVQMRRKQRRPNTLSLYDVPVFECNADDFETDFDRCARAMVQAMIDHSQNLKEMKLTQKYEGRNEEEDSEGEEIPGS